MAETWDPTGNPVHFLIEMGDVLAGSYLRFRLASTVDMPRCRAELDAVQDGVMAWANVGTSRELLVNRAVAWWVNRYKDAGQATNHDEITNLVAVGFINAFVAMCHIRPAVHSRDLSGTPADPETRVWRVETLNAQNRGFELLDRARSDAFARLARLGITVPARVAGRSVAGDVPGGVAFHDLSAELPAYAPDQAPTTVVLRDCGYGEVEATAGVDTPVELRSPSLTTHSHVDLKKGPTLPSSGWIDLHFQQQQQQLLKRLWGQGLVSAVDLKAALSYTDPLTADSNLGKTVTRTNKNLAEMGEEIGSSWAVSQRTVGGTKHYLLECLSPTL